MYQKWLLIRVVLLAMALVWSTAPLAEAQEAAPETPGLKHTQVTVTYHKGGKQFRFRATVMARKDLDLTILTAAHCVAEDDKDRPIELLLGHESVKGTILSVVRNPSYRTNQSTEIPGADNAVARLRMVQPADEPALKAFESIKPPRGITARAYPGPDGQTVSVHMTDGQGVEHALKAGNHRNPRYLEWGLSYKPNPGDSGGGVFVVQNVAGAEPRLILIGIIVGRDDRGGAASLVSNEMGWLADALSRSQ